MAGTDTSDPGSALLRQAGTMHLLDTHALFARTTLTIILIQELDTHEGVWIDVARRDTPEQAWRGFRENRMGRQLRIIRRTVTIQEEPVPEPEA